MLAWGRFYQRGDPFEFDTYIHTYDVSSFIKKSHIHQLIYVIFSFHLYPNRSFQPSQARQETESHLLNHSSGSY